MYVCVHVCVRVCVRACVCVCVCVEAQVVRELQFVGKDILSLVRTHTTTHARTHAHTHFLQRNGECRLDVTQNDSETTRTDSPERRSLKLNQDRADSDRSPTRTDRRLGPIADSDRPERTREGPQLTQPDILTVTASHSEVLGVTRSDSE